MRTLAYSVLALLALASVSPAFCSHKPQPRVAPRPSRAAPGVACPQEAPQPAGVCQPYDREHCSFADGTLLHDDPRDERAPYLLRQVSAGVYCRYDAALKPAGVALIDTPEEQKKKWDATKARRRH